MNVHAGISNSNGAVISKSRTGLRIVVRDDLLVNLFKPFFATIFSRKLSSASDAKHRWSVAKHSLHSADAAVYCDNNELSLVP
jgi:hypothetical protein